jgi:hypothetical protein
MKMLLLAAPVLLGGAFALFQMPATPPMRMGLWETEAVTKMAMPDMPAGMPAMGPRTTKVRSCMTPETYQKYLGASASQKDCVRSNEVWSAHSYKFDIACNSGRMAGHAEIFFDSKEASHGVTHMEMKGPRSMTVDATTTTKFISADCGAVSPEKPEIVR